MTHTVDTWNGYDHRCWAAALGLAYSPMFGTESDTRHGWSGPCGVLLDGQRSSFAICSTPQLSQIHDKEPASWSWSANLRHVVLLNEANDDMFLHRWDIREYRQFQLPASARAAEQLLGLLNSAPQPEAPDVILHVLRAFRGIRSVVPNRDALEAIRLFNTILLAAEAVDQELLDQSAYAACRNGKEVLRLLGKINVERFNRDVEICKSALDLDLSEAIISLVQPEPISGCRLSADLLLRHASGQLYQEAHLIIEKENQMRLPGMLDAAAPRGTLQRDARFTPTTLARLLVQQALAAINGDLLRKKELEILDPACGSGVFLQEAVRELAARQYRGRVKLRGFDLSSLACTITEFCLSKVKEDAEASGIRVDVKVCKEDALAVSWGNPDLILMNPPFSSWPAMDIGERESIGRVLGTVLKGRPDKAMAFIWKAAECLGKGSALATVLPSAILETEAGTQWREGLANRGDIYLIGRFKSFGFFRGSLVEPAFLVLRRPREPALDDTAKVVLANEGSEDSSIRALRRYDMYNTPVVEEGYEVFGVTRAKFQSTSWMPRSRKALEVVERLASSDMPTVEQLFEVCQGIRTGKNAAFVLTDEQFATLPESEKRFFRCAATNDSIVCGQLNSSRYVFYPYDESGLLLNSEADLEKNIPFYWRKWLVSLKEELKKRKGIKPDHWWSLTRGRTWQHQMRPKLVTKYFGESGGFAYDDSGDYVVLQGHAWFWRVTPHNTAEVSPSAPDDEPEWSFERSPLPYAYLAILNSALFSSLLSHFCPQVQGGQFNLSPKFMNEVFVPDLGDELRFPSDLVRVLAHLGEQIHRGADWSSSQLQAAVARAYGLSSEELAGLCPETP